MGIRVLLIMVLISIFLAGCNPTQPPGSTPILERLNETPSPTPTLPNLETVPIVKTAVVELKDQNQAVSTLQITQTPELLPGSLPYSPQLGSPQYLPAFTQPESGCNWVGVAGQIFDGSMNPVENVVIVVKGFFDGKAVNGMALSGLGKAYGPGGFEVKLGDKAMDTSGAVTVQLFNDKFESLSELYPITTYNDCQKNLIIYNFQGIMTVQNLYLPVVVR